MTDILEERMLFAICENGKHASCPQSYYALDYTYQAVCTCSCHRPRLSTETS